MRDRLARTAAVGLVALIVCLAALFAGRMNAGPETATPAGTATPGEAPPTSPPEPVEAELVARGREVYGALPCSRCHSIAGQGNPRAPLDDVGTRRSPSEIRAWITASEGARGELSRSVIRSKEAFASLPQGDLEALVAYLSSLR